MPKLQPHPNATVRFGTAAMAAGEVLMAIGAVLAVYAVLSPHTTVIGGIGAMTAALVPGGLGIAVIASVRGQHASNAGDATGAAADRLGVVSGAAVTVSAIVIATGLPGGAILLVIAALGLVVVSAFHARRRLRR
jgi:hypothetical protein